MLTIALRDLQWRTRRVVIATVGASLVLALGLVMSGLSAGFDNESARTVGLARATGWIVDQGGTGPFLQPSPLGTATIDAVVAQVGPTHAAPLLFGRQSVHRPDGSSFGEHQHVNLVGAVPVRLGAPDVRRGHGLTANGQAVVDKSLGAAINSRIRLGNRTYVVVGEVQGARLLAGVPNVYVTLSDARALMFGGAPLATAVVVDRPVRPPAGTKLFDNAAAKTDGLRPVVNAEKTIAMVRTLLWLVAALIVGSVTYLGVLERTKDVAVLKGMGARTSALMSSLAMQAVVLGLGASLIGAVVARLLVPVFPLSAEIPSSAYLLLPVVAIVCGLLASAGAARRLVSIQPALAFGS